MATFYRCDRCKAEVKYASDLSKLQITQSDSTRLYLEDICEPCVREIISSIKNIAKSA